MIRFRLRNDLIPVSLHVLIGDKHRASKWVLNTFGREWQAPYGAGRADVIEAGKGVGFECIIWMPYFRVGDAFDAGVLAHESLHIVWRLLEKYGIYDEETHCYLMQWIVNEATFQIKRRLKRHSR